MTHANKPYPPPPWTMHGYSYFAPYRVRTASLKLPPGFEVAHPGPFTVGVLGYVKYTTPSPLTYDELVWMPCYVRAPGFGSRGRGWFVSVMYVSETHTLEGGREIWKLPKTLAKFDVRTDGCDVRADDGTRASFAWSDVGTQRSARAKIGTLQYNDGVSLCRFAGDFRSRSGLARMRATSFESGHASWMGFDPEARLPLPAVTQKDFVATMQVPTFVKRER